MWVLQSCALLHPYSVVHPYSVIHVMPDKCKPCIQHWLVHHELGHGRQTLLSCSLEVVHLLPTQVLSGVCNRPELYILISFVLDQLHTLAFP